MNPDTPATLFLIAHPVLAAGIVALFANIFVCGVLYGTSGTATRHRQALIAWGRRTFTAAGDRPSCRCDRVHVEVFCPACRHVRVLTPTSTLSTGDSNILLGQCDEAERRREAMTAFDEIDLDLDEQAVM